VIGAGFTTREGCSFDQDFTECRHASEGSLVDASRTEAADAELVRMIERRSRKGAVDTDELEPFYMESVRRYNARRRAEMRAAWCEHHQGQAERLRRTLEALASHHEEQAAKLTDVEPKGAA
jgi:hypothetical protein